jgi:hypothetical protein
MPKPGNEWFLCPHCDLPVRKQVNRNGNAELQPGMRYARSVRILQYLTNKPEGNPILSTNSKSPQYDLSALLISFETMQARLAGIQKRQVEIKSARENLGRQINDLTKNREQRERFHAEVDKLSTEYDANTLYEKQLMQARAFIAAERARAKTDNSSLVAAGSLLLAIGGLVLFAWVGGVDWDWKTIGMSTIIVIATTVVTFNVANSN